MNWLDRLRDWMNRPEVAEPSADALREARELRTENTRHIDAIERHVERVTNRVREDAVRADDRVRGR